MTPPSPLNTPCALRDVQRTTPHIDLMLPRTGARGLTLRLGNPSGVTQLRAGADDGRAHAQPHLYGRQ